jgi:hypothetical protein
MVTRSGTRLRIVLPIILATALAAVLRDHGIEVRLAYFRGRWSPGAGGRG